MTDPKPLSPEAQEFLKMLLHRKQETVIPGGTPGEYELDLIGFAARLYDERTEAARLEHQASFDLRWSADMRAIKRWQEATGKTLVWPDHADLCVWLLGEVERQKEALKESEDRREALGCSLTGAQQALRKCVLKFREHEAIYLAKRITCGEACTNSRGEWYCPVHKIGDPVDGCMVDPIARVKAQVNANMAAMCEAALATAPADGEVERLREALRGAVYCIDHHWAEDHPFTEPCDCDPALAARAALAPVSTDSPLEPYAARVNAWMLVCFGPAVTADKTERVHRFVEEALELAQSLGGTAVDSHRLVEYVFGRPIGEAHQETGGVLVTLAALCNAAGIDMQRAGEDELSRVWGKIDVIREKQKAKPKGSPLPVPADSGERTDK